jgi:hypothetical protein
MAAVQLSSGQAGLEFRALAKKLRRAGATDLRKSLRQKISAAGGPVVDDVKQAVRDLQVTSSHGGGTGQRRKHNVGRAKASAKTDLAKARKRMERRGAGLRETVAAGVRLQTTAKGVKIIATSDRLPESQKSLPRHLDSDKGWRHPVFGDTNKWVHQRGGPWFAATIKPKAPAFRAACLEAMDEIKDQLGH